MSRRRTITALAPITRGLITAAITGLDPTGIARGDIGSRRNRGNYGDSAFNCRTVALRTVRIELTHLLAARDNSLKLHCLKAWWLSECDAVHAADERFLASLRLSGMGTKSSIKSGRTSCAG
jgi:hypothetical protein